MVNDGLDCDIKNILECRENEEFEVLQRLSAYCHDIHTRTAASLAGSLIFCNNPLKCSRFRCLSQTAAVEIPVQFTFPYRNPRSQSCGSFKTARSVDASKSGETKHQ